MMLFMGLYTLVDTIFVAQLVNTDALSSINIVCPVLNVLVGLGTMLATGGNALISRKMGEGKEKEAREDFTLLILTGIVTGSVISMIGIARLDPLVSALGASPLLFPYCRDYLLVLFCFLPANMLQTLFANLFVTAGKPGLGLCLSVLAGVANLVLDYVFIALCRLGIRGAALGTGFGYLIPAIAGLVYFARGKGSLSFTRPRVRWRVLREACLNGSSEMVSQLATAVTTFLYNLTMMDLLGEDGVAAITILIYSQFLLNTLYLGFSIGVAPVIGFLYGTGNRVRQKRVFRSNMGFLAGASGVIFLLSLLGGSPMVQLFAADTSRVYEIAAQGFPVFSFGFLFCGFNIFASSMFTALSGGRISAVLSFLRTFVLLSGGILYFPRLLGPTGIWLAVPVAEGVMFLVSLVCLMHYREKYRY